MGNQTCPCKAAPTKPVCQKLGSPYGGPGASSSSSSAGPPKSAVNYWGFNALELSSFDLGQVAYDLMLGPLIDCNGGSTDDLQGFVNRTQKGYFRNVFHSFHHAVDVLQMVMMLGRLMPWEVLASPHQRLALAVAALAHDIGHPGFSNIFLVEVCDELAVRYNDESPLENMHCSKLFEILRTKGADVFAKIPRDELRPLRKLMIDAIMQTDTTRHGALTAALDSLSAEHAEAFFGSCDPGKQESAGLTTQQMAALSKDQNQALLAVALLHSADVSHACRPWSVANCWALRAQEELFLQGDEERSLGLPVQPLNDRKTADIPDGQLGFIHTVVAPLVSAEVRLFRAWHELATSLAANSQEWAGKLVGDPAAEKADPRLQEVCAMLEGAVQGRPGSKSPSGTMAEEPCSEPSCEAAITQPPLVREVRRWQEQRSDGQNRELVLLYVVSESAPGSGGKGQKGQPILFRYGVKGEREASEANFSPPAAAPEAVDAGCTNVETAGFDGLLSELLHNEKGTAVSAVPSSSEQSGCAKRSSTQSNSWRRWLTGIGHSLAPGLSSANLGGQGK